MRRIDIIAPVIDDCCNNVLMLQSPKANIINAMLAEVASLTLVIHLTTHNITEKN